MKISIVFAKSSISDVCEGSEYAYTSKFQLFLTHSAPEYFEKLALKKRKTPNLNGYISKTRANSE